MVTPHQCKFCRQVFEAELEYDKDGYALLHCPSCEESEYVHRKDERDIGSKNG